MAQTTMRFYLLCFGCEYCLSWKEEDSFEQGDDRRACTGRQELSYARDGLRKQEIDLSLSYRHLGIGTMPHRNQRSRIQA